MVRLPAPGHRVVVRYLLPSGQATDALGMLLSADAATVVVDGVRGVERIAVAAIIAAKEVPPAPAPRSRKVTPDERTPDMAQEQLYFREFGDPGNPPLVLVHGLFGDSLSMTPLATEFADRFRVIVVDALGHGLSPRPAGFTLADQGVALNALIASLGYDSAPVLGVSMGSYVAAQAAALEPDRISRLVLVATKGQGATSSSAAYAERNGFDLATATMEETMAFMAGALWSPDTTQERRDELMALQGAPSHALTADERAAIERSLTGFDLRPQLPSVTARTLVISGHADGLNTPEVGREVADLIPGARFEVYEHSGHMLAFEEKDRLVADVTEMLLA